MNTTPYPIYVIHLRRVPERKLYMQRQLDALNLNYQFVDAVDKYDLQSAKYRTELAHLLGIDRHAIEYKYVPNYAPHLACTLSHIKVYNLMKKHNHSAACVLEDDVAISSDFPKILHAAQKAHWDILMLSSKSRTSEEMLGANLKLFKIAESHDIDCSLFPRLRKTKWYRRMLPLAPASPKQLDWTRITKLEWLILMLTSHSRAANCLFKYFGIYNLLKFSGANKAISHEYKKGQRQSFISCKIGALPIRSSQQTLYKDYDIATPAESLASGMAYLLRSTATNKWREIAASKNRVPIDGIPWHLKKKYNMQLRIVTPPCASASLNYLRYSARARSNSKFQLNE